MSTLRRIGKIDVYSQNFKQRGNKKLQQEMEGQRNLVQVLHVANEQNFGQYEEIR